ncbi:MAG: ABC transporter ATP-binding protein [Actinomycetota bacterium]|nr:ABC transporter ATP-binding protein [Actinomycetota bacterium]
MSPEGHPDDGSVITVENVSKRFRLYKERNQSLKSTLLQRRRGRFEEFWALRDVSLDVPRGAAMGLIGENGSGKSTLLKCMARILRPDAGRISTEGKVSALLELGAGFHHELSGRENVYLNGSILGLSRKELDRKFDDIVQFAGLERFIDTPVKNYSSGMYLRLGFSVAINVDPDILLVDEVLAVGDENFQRRCREKFGELRARGRTVVLVSHALDSVRELCDVAAWLEGGRLRAVGDVDEVVDHYLHAVDEGAADRAGPVPAGGDRSVIAHIDLLDQKHEPTREALTGDRVTIRFHYELDEAVSRPVFAMAIHTVEGIEVTATDTAGLSLVPEPAGRGHVDFEVDSLPLLPGTYDISAVLSERESGAVLDAHHRAFRFVVDAGAPAVSSRGIVDVRGTWLAHSSVPFGRAAGSAG